MVVRGGGGTGVYRSQGGHRSKRALGERGARFERSVERVRDRVDERRRELGRFGLERSSTVPEDAAQSAPDGVRGEERGGKIGKPSRKNEGKRRAEARRELVG